MAAGGVDLWDAAEVGPAWTSDRPSGSCGGNGLLCSQLGVPAKTDTPTRPLATGKKGGRGTL